MTHAVKHVKIMGFSYIKNVHIPALEEGEIVFYITHPSCA